MKHVYLFFVTIGIAFFAFGGWDIAGDDSLMAFSYDGVAAHKKANTPQRKQKNIGSRQKVASPYKPIRFLPSLAVSVTANKTVTVVGGGNAIPGSQLDYQIVVANSGSTDATGALFTDILVDDLTLNAGTLIATPIAANDAYTAIGNVGITVPLANGVLGNDVNPIPANTLTITAFDATTTGGGAVTMTTSGANAGAFTYTPAVGYSGTDTFTYTIDNSSGTANTSRTGTVTITVASPVWFVNSSATTNGNGTLTSPFKEWSDFNTANTGATGKPNDNHIVFIYSGSYNSTATLRAGQKIIGQGATATLASLTGVTTQTYHNALPATNGTRPNLTSTGTTITLASNNTLRGFNMGNSTTDITGTTFGTLTASEITLDGTGAALNLSNGVLAANFTSISSSNATTDVITFYTISGTLTSAGGTTITNPTGAGISIYTNSSLTANFGNTSIQGSSNYGIIVTSSSSNLTFGSLDITPDAAVQALQVNSSGSFTCTSGTIVTSNVIGMGISGSSASAKLTLNVVLTSISASGSSSGFNMFNTLGSFTVTGSGTTAGSGGTIQNMTVDAVFVSGVTNITLKNMNFTNANTVDATLDVNDFSVSNASIKVSSTVGFTLNNVIITGSAQRGISGKSISNFSMTNCTVNNSGNAINEGGVFLQDLSGNCSITGSTITRANEHLIRIFNTSVDLNLTISNSNISDTQTTPTNTASAVVGNGILASTYGTGKTYITVSNCTLNKIGSDAIKTYNTNTSRGSYDISGCTIDPANTAPITTGNDVGTAIEIASQGTSTVYVDIHDNTSFKGRGGVIVTVAPDETSTMHGKIRNNVLSFNNAANDANACSCPAINVFGQANATGRFTISGNTITNVQSGSAISVNSRNGVSPASRIDATVTNNNITMPTQTIGTGRNIFVESGNTSSSFNNMCANVANNQNNNTSGINGVFRLSSFGGANGTLYIQSTGTDAVSAWNNNGNTQTVTSSTASLRSGSNAVFGNTGLNVCLLPDAPPALVISAIAQVEAKKIISEDNSVASQSNADSLIVSETDEVETLSSDATKTQNSVEAVQSGETISLTYATIPAGKGSTIKFRATVSSTPSTCAIANQGTVSGANFANVLTDDPGVSGVANPTVTNLVLPIPTSVLPTTASAICIGFDVSLSASCTSGTVQWYNAAAPTTLLGTGSSFTHAPTANITYQASCKLGGCESAKVSTALITVNNKPLVNITGASAICVGTTTALSPTTGGTWASSNTAVATVTNAGVVTGVANGSATFTFTQTSTGCISLATSAVTVSARPIVNVTGASAICVGATTALSPTTGGTWVSSNTAIATVTNAGVVTGVANGSATFTFTETSSGCSSLATSAVTVNARPVVNITGSTTICAGLTSALSPTTGGTWVSSNTAVATVTNAGVVTGVSSGSATFTFTQTSTGCTSLATSAITVNSTAAPTSPTASPASRTTVGSVTLSVSGCDGGTLTWYNASTNVAVPSPNNQPNLSSTTSFYAKCTGANTCVSQASTNVTVIVTLCTPLVSSPGNVNITWTGTEGTDWNTPCNWSPAWVPDASNAQAVIDLRTNQPTVTGTVPAIKVMYINAGATLTVASSGALTINESGAPNYLTMQGGGSSIINDGTISVGAGTGGFGIAATGNASITNRGTINTDNSYGIVGQSPNTLNVLNESAGIINSGFRSISSTAIINLTNHGTINYSGTSGAEVILFPGSGSSFINDGTVNAITGNGILIGSGSTLTNSACGKIFMSSSVATYTNGGTTTNAGLIQLRNNYNFTNTGTFTNNGVLKANTVSAITNNKMVITNACPIFTLGGSNNYTVSGIFTDNAATTSAGIYVLGSNKFTANNTIPTGSQTLYAQVTDETCTFIIPFNFNNVKPTTVTANNVSTNTAVCNGSSVTLKGTCASGTLTWYTQATGGTAIGTGTDLSNIPNTVTTYYAACETTNCSSGRIATGAVSIITPPSAPTATGATICNGGSVTLTATGCSGSGLALLWYKSSDNSLASMPVSPLVNTDYYAKCELTTNGVTCTSPASTAVTVTVLNPLAPTATGATICSGGSVTLTATGCSGSGTVLKWYKSSDNSLASMPVSPVVNTDYYAKCELTTNGVTCTSPASTAVTVTVLNPLAPMATGATICNGGSVTLTATGCSGSGTVLKWYKSSDNSLASMPVSPLVNTDYYAKCELTTNGVTCISPASTAVTVTVGNPSAPTATGATICSGSSVTLTATGCSGSGLALLWYKSSDNSLASMPVSPLVNTDYYAKCELTTNGVTCISPASTAVTVTVLNPLAPTATGATICSGGSVTLTATGCSGSGLALLWYKSSDNSLASMPVSPLVNTDYYAKCELTTNGVTCTSPASTAVTVTVLNPLAPTATGATICNGGSVTLTATGCSGSGTVLKWYKSSDNSLASMPVSPVVNTDYYAKCELTTNGVTCISPASTAVTVTVGNPSAPTATGATICNGGSVTLTATGCSGSGLALLWYKSSDNSLASMPVSPLVNTDYYAKCELTTNGVTCTSPASTAVTVTVLNPLAPTATGATICNGGSVTLTATGCSGSGTVLKWYKSSDNSLASMPVSPLVNTDYYAKCELTTNGVTCISPASTMVTVTVLNPLAPTATGATICSGGSVTLTATGCSGSGTVLKWYKSSDNSLASMPVSPVVNTDYYAKCELTTNGVTCISPASTAVTVTVGNPSAPIATGATICNGGSVTLTATGCSGSGLALLWYKSSDNSLASMPVSPLVNTDYYAKCELTTNGVTCISPASTAVTVTVLNPLAPTATGATICNGSSVTLTATGCSGSGTVLKWYKSSDNSLASMPVSPLVNTDYYAKCELTTNGITCISPASTAVTVTVLNPLAPTATGATICNGGSVTLTATGCTGSGTVLKWYKSSDNSLASMPVSPVVNTDYYAKCELTTNGVTCISPASTAVTVTILSPPTPTAQANTQTIFGGSVTLSATGCSGVLGTFELKWYQVSDNSLVTMPVAPTATSSYYAKCEQTLNGVSCLSVPSANVQIEVLNPTPPVATEATICAGSSVSLTATGCTGSVGTFVLKWYQNSDDVLVTMPISPSVSTGYYAKCEQTFNAVTAVSAKSNVVTVTVLNPITPVATAATIYKGNSTVLTATGCTGTGFVLKWYQTTDNTLVSMPVSPVVSTQYYAKCEQTANSVTCISTKSNDVTLTVVNRIFVDITKLAAPTQNGISWATAYGDLQTALAVATASEEVWVAKGVYKPTSTIDRTIYFRIPSNVIVYGGFAGTENALADRNFRTNVSILSGEIGNLNDRSDNAYHVVLFSGSANATVLNGFTITGGNANFNPNRVVTLPISSTPVTTTIETGGGIALQNGSSPTIENCTIMSNTGVTGGGIYAGEASSPIIKACKFIGNQATFGSGIYLQDNSNAEISNTLIGGNRGVGGLYNNRANPTLTNCTFGGNGGYNGGVFNSNSQPIIKNTIIWGNSTPFNDNQSTITYSIIQGGYVGIGNLNYDPQFVSPSIEGLSPMITGDFHVQATSLAIDRGNNDGISLSALDLDGNLRRFSGGTVDIGAYEFQGSGTGSVVISVATGNWESNSTWDAGRVPQVGDLVIINNAHTVTLNGTGNAKNVEYRGTGTLKFNSTNSKLNIGF